MDLIKRNKTLTVLVIILIIMNASVLSIIWLNSPNETLLPPPPPKHRSPGDMVKFLKKELRLSDEQVSAFIQLRQKHFMEVNKIGQEMHGLKKQLMENIFTSNEINADSLSSEIGQLQSKLELITYKHFNELKKVCGEEQAIKLRKLLGGFFRDREVKKPPLGDPPPPPPVIE